MSDPNSERLAELIEIAGDVCNGSVMEDRLVRLQELVQDPRMMQAYVEYMDLHAELGAWAADELVQGEPGRSGGLGRVKGAAGLVSKETRRKTRRVAGRWGVEGQSDPWPKKVAVATAAGVVIAAVVTFVLGNLAPEGHEKISKSPARRSAETAKDSRSDPSRPSDLDPGKISEEPQEGAKARFPEPQSSRPDRTPGEAPPKEPQVPAGADPLLPAKPPQVPEVRPAKSPDSGETRPGPGVNPPDPGTQIAIARVQRVEGEAYAHRDGARKPAQAEATIVAGQGLETVGKRSSVTLVYPDKTRVDLGSETEIRDLREAGGKRFFVANGSVRVIAIKQPPGQPMVIETQHAEARVLGTTLRIIVDPDPKSGTRLEVDEGKVEFKRKVDGRAVEVVSGHYAVAAVGLALAARRIPLDEILLLPEQARVVGPEWRPVKDPEASRGVCLEVSKVPAQKSPAKLSAAAHVALTFQAEKDKEYRIWMRGRRSPNDVREEPIDAVVIEVAGGTLVEPKEAEGTLTFGPERAVFGGYGHLGRPGYAWVSGYAKHEAEPVTVRFQRAGAQTLRIYAYENLVRIDAIWISATVKVRPDDGATGPGPEPRK